MLEIEAPDGTIVEFPDGTPDDVIEKAMRQAYLQPAPPPGARVHTQSRAIATPEDEQSYLRELEVARRAKNIEAVPYLSSAAQGASLGGMDEFVAATSAPFMSLRTGRPVSDEYAMSRDAMRQALESERTDRQVGSMVAEVAGAVPTALVPLGSAAKALQSGNIGTRLAAGAGLAGAEGAVYGFNAGEGGTAERVKNARDVGLLSAALGGAAPAVGAGVRRTARSIAKGRGLAQAAKTAPSTQELRTASNAAFESARQAGVEVQAPSFGRFVTKLSRDMTQEGLDPTLHPGATAAIKRLGDAVTGPVSLDNIQTLRRVAVGAAKDINNPDQQRIAGMIVDALDDYVDNLSPRDLTRASGGGVRRAAKELSDARKLWGRMRRTELLEEAIDKAQNQASGFENGIRTQFRSILNNKKKRRGFSAFELEVMRDVVRGNFTRNTLKRLGKLGFGAGQQSNMLMGSLGAAGGAAVGGPVGAFAVPMIGQGAMKASEAMTRRQANQARALVARGSANINTQLGDDMRRVLESMIQRNARVTAPLQDRLASDVKVNSAGDYQ